MLITFAVYCRYLWDSFLNICRARLHCFTQTIEQFLKAVIKKQK